MNECKRALQVLLVEDNRGDAFLIKEMLRDTGIELSITVAEDGQKALTILDRVNGNMDRPLDFVILDLNLPKINGFEVLSYMKKMHGMKDIPVVVMTGSLNDADRVRSMDMGATNFLNKPSSNKDFEAIVGWMKMELTGLDKVGAEKCLPQNHGRGEVPGDPSDLMRGSLLAPGRAQSYVFDRMPDLFDRFGPS